MLWQRQGLLPGRDRSEIMQPMLADHMPHALARAFAPERDDNALAVALQFVDMRGECLEHIGAGRIAFGGKIMAGMSADLDDARLFRRGEWRQPGQRRLVEPRPPLRF